MLRELAVIVATATALASFAIAQPTFEVASIRPSVGPDPAYAAAYTAGALMGGAGSPCSGGKVELSGSRVRITLTSVCDLIRIAYEVRNLQVAGAPQAPSMTLAEALAPGNKPIPVFFYDIEAKAPDQPPLNDSLLHAMLRSLLADRFGLMIHRDTKELSYSALIAGKNGLKPGTKVSSDCKPGPDGDFVQLCNQTIDKVIRALSGSGHSIVDMTGITDSFQYRIPDFRNDPDRETDTRAAILDQLGLRIESRKGPMEVIVVDHVSPPSPN